MLDRSGGNGLFGMGWSVALPSERRRANKQLPTYDDASDRDTFPLADVEEIVAALRNEGSDCKLSWTPHVVGDRTA